MKEENTEKYPYTILFIEDEEIILDNYTTYLKKIFSNVLTARDGEEALKIYNEEKPQIIIADIHIPKINGLSLLEMIRKKDFDVKLIVLTGHVTTEFLLQATSLKLINYLQKPISRLKLKESLSKAIDEISNYKVIRIENIILKDGYSWDIRNKTLKRENELIELTKKEILLLDLLFSNTEKIFSYDEILYQVWNDFDDEGNINSLKNLVRRLRLKLPDETIENVFKEGYRIKSK